MALDNNDFVGSFADENVEFTTQIVRNVSVGDNYWKAMIFVEDDRYIVDTSLAGWTAVPGAAGCKARVVTVEDYAQVTNDVLSSWLYDLFCNGYSGDCILVSCGSKPKDESAENAYETIIANMRGGYNALKAYAYHKTCCIGPNSASAPINVKVAVELAKMCASDKNLLSSAPYFPFVTSGITEVGNDALYAELKTADTDAFMSFSPSPDRNGALFSLGLAMTYLNGSGTVVGTSMDMIKSNMMSSSGLDVSVKDAFSAANIQYFKPIGDNTGYVAAVGATTIKGDVVQANWIISYVTYMTKVQVAKLITEPNMLKNGNTYASIINIMANNLSLFGESGSQRLKNINITAPAYNILPEAKGDEYIIPDAWNAQYVDQVRKVKITGSLYIG